MQIKKKTSTRPTAEKLKTIDRTTDQTDDKQSTIERLEQRDGGVHLVTDHGASQTLQAARSKCSVSAISHKTGTHHNAHASSNDQQVDVSCCCNATSNAQLDAEVCAVQTSIDSDSMARPCAQQQETDQCGNAAESAHNAMTVGALVLSCCARVRVWQGGGNGSGSTNVSRCQKFTRWQSHLWDEGNSFQPAKVVSR